MATILIIDDDPVFADMAKQRLERATHTVHVHVGPFGEGPAHRRDRWPRNELGPCPDSWDPCH